MNNIVKNIVLSPFNVLYSISPEKELKLLFFLHQGYRLNLKNPATYNEKLQWIKLYDHNPLMPVCCDKYQVRKFVEDQGCGEILNDLLWEGFDPEQIPFDDLPDQYVIKVTHGSTFNIIQDGTEKINRSEVIRKCNLWLHHRFLPCYGEWFYGQVKPRVIVEKYIESTDDRQLRDYKVFCFDGIPKLIRVDTDRFTKHKQSFYDVNWNKINDVDMGFLQDDRMIEKPACLEQLLSYAARLSKPFRHARVDFYITKEQIYFGEITFTNGAGFDKFHPYDFDLKLGGYLRIGDTDPA